MSLLPQSCSTILLSKCTHYSVLQITTGSCSAGRMPNWLYSIGESSGLPSEHFDSRYLHLQSERLHSAQSTKPGHRRPRVWARSQCLITWAKRCRITPHVTRTSRNSPGGKWLSGHQRQLHRLGENLQDAVCRRRTLRQTGVSRFRGLQRTDKGHPGFDLALPGSFFRAPKAYAIDSKLALEKDGS